MARTDVTAPPPDCGGGGCFLDRKRKRGGGGAAVLVGEERTAGKTPRPPLTAAPSPVVEIRLVPCERDRGVCVCVCWFDCDLWE
ncbi:hypothetical protein Hanom_Chr14g01253941 [Helianthus anomalus]